MDKLIYVEYDYDGLYTPYWELLGEVRRNRAHFLANPQEYGLVCFTGGDDVSPELYGHKNLGSYNSMPRDIREMEVFQVAQKAGIPMFSICRGAQFTSVMCGGTMIQDLKAPHGGAVHRCETFDDQDLEITSSHHQMIVPGPGGEVLAWASQRLNVEHCAYDGDLPSSVMDSDDSHRVKVSEVVFYAQEKVLCCQSHPEWQKIEDPFPQYILNLSKQLCFEGEALEA